MPNRPSPTDPIAGTVLCIEDDRASMALIEAIFEPHPGVRLLKAADGRSGIALARAEAPDLVLLDMNLPDVGGLEVMRELNPLVAERRLRVVLLTGASFSIDVVKAMSLGAREYWPKPLDLALVRAALARLLSASAPSAPRSGAT